MKDVLGSKNPQRAQTLVFFLAACGLIFLLCGFAIDSGLLYLAKARLSRAVDGAALAAVGNFHQASNPATNRDDVANIMKNFAFANYTDLQSATLLLDPSGGTLSYYTTSTGASAAQYTYTYFDNSPVTGGRDSSGNFRRYVQIVLQTGAGGQITTALCNARCPVHTYFINYSGAFRDLKVSSNAVATRNPRLIMVVVDRSASMLASGGGAFGLPAAITTFLNFFDTSSDYIGLVSFGSAARLEMPLTTNFLYAGTNNLYDSYQIDNNGTAIPGVDPEEATNYYNYLTNGPRRMKFGGETAADEGLRMGLEQLMQNPGFTNPNVVKYIVLFTDGAWNTSRTLVAAPGYTDVTVCPVAPANQNSYTVTGAVAAQYGVDGYLPLPNLSPWPDYSNAVTFVPPVYSPNGFDAQDHQNDVWQSADGVNEPLSGATIQQGAPVTVNNNSQNSSGNPTGYLLTLAPNAPPLYSPYTTYIYTTSFNVWLPPGSVDYVYGSSSTPINAYVSDYTHPTNTVNITLSPGQSNVLVVPGYVADGILCDVLDLSYPDDPSNGGASYPRYRADNYTENFMWPDDPAMTDANSSATNLPPNMRALMFRNYANLLTGYYVFRPDDPLGASTDTNSFTGQTNALNGNGPYYPSAGFYWPFDLVGVDGRDERYNLRDAVDDPDTTDTGQARFIEYSINMLSTNAAPEYAGELFYQGTQGTGVVSGTTAVSSQITNSSQWQGSGSGMYPPFVTPFIDAQLMTNEPSHFPVNGNGNPSINGALWRPVSFNGSNSLNGLVTSTNQISLTDPLNYTGGYVTDGNGNIYRNTMAYSGRPTHYYDFSTSTWKTIPDNHDTNKMALPLGNWKAQEYAWHARQQGVTIYTVGYGTAVNDSECALLAQVANSTNVITTSATNSRSYNPNQPIGQEFYATTPSDISNDFYQVGTSINGALTQ